VDTYDFILDDQTKNKRKPKGKPRKMPLHVIMAMNKAKTDESGTPTEPSFRCSICGVLYRPDVMKFYKQHTLSPDIEVCAFCYWNHELDRPVPPHPSTARYSSPGPRATTLELKIAMVTAFLTTEYKTTHQACAVMVSEHTDAYIQEVEQVSHGHAYVEKFFGKRGRFNQVALVEDFSTFVAYS